MRLSGTAIVAIFALAMGIMSPQDAASQGQNQAEADIQNLVGRQDDDGSWCKDPSVDTDCDEDSDPVIETAKIVSSIIRRHTVDPDTGQVYQSPFTDYQYSESIEKGLGYLIEQAQFQSIAVQSAGNPDWNGNSMGICVNCGTENETIATGMVLNTLCQTVQPQRAATTIPKDSPSSDPTTYLAVAQDILDYLAFGQVDEGQQYRGTWGSQANTDPLAHPVFPNEAEHEHTVAAWQGIRQATDSTPDGCGLALPPFVNDELEIWNSRNAAPVDDFGDDWKECPEDWKEGKGRSGGPYPRCFQLTRDLEFDLKVPFQETVTPFLLRPCVPDPRYLLIFGPKYCWDDDGWQAKLLSHVTNDMPAINLNSEHDPSDPTSAPSPEQQKMFFELEENGILKLYKGFRWDGPTPPGKMKKPFDYRDVLMRSSAVHDAVYDLMRMGHLENDPYSVRVRDSLGFRNQLIADSAFYLLAMTDKTRASAGGFYWGIRVGGQPNTEEPIADFKIHALADAGEDQPIECASPEAGSEVLLNGSNSSNWTGDTYVWGWWNGSEYQQVQGITPDAVQFDVGEHDVKLTVDCDNFPDGHEDKACNAYYKDTDEITLKISADDVPPKITEYPWDVTAQSHLGTNWARINYNIKATDNCGVPTITCNRPSGSKFFSGVTDVYCIAQDIGGLTDEVRFKVFVNRPSDRQKSGGGGLSLATIIALLTIAIAGRAREAANSRLAVWLASRPHISI